MISIITGGLGLLAALTIIFLIRKDRLHVHHGMGWVILAAGFALLGFLPGLIDSVAAKLGVAYPPALALTLAIIVLVLKILLMDIERSRTEMRNQRLIQRVAMLESDLKKLQRQTASEAGDDQH